MPVEEPEATAMRVRSISILFLAFILPAIGCGSSQPTYPVAAPGGVESGRNVHSVGIGASASSSDSECVRGADVSILFVGNSHTMLHDLPDLVCRMIRFRFPKKAVYSHSIWVSFLEDVARNPRCKEEIESRPWKYVVLQAQKISASGRYDYSRKEGITIAKLARAQGSTVMFFSEWGLKGVAGDGARNEKIYQEMARAADVQVAPIGRAWDLALTQRPELQLHAPDGNHQSAVGAFLTASVLFGRITGESPTALAPFGYAELDERDRAFLADAATRALAQNAVGQGEDRTPRPPHS
jgi:hypothetical protein